jgi:hypothetical protein
MFGMGGSQAKAGGAGAKKAKAAAKPELVAVTVKLEPRHREKLKLLGGDAWLREQIEQAKVEAVFGAPD